MKSFAQEIWVVLQAIENNWPYNASNYCLNRFSHLSQPGYNVLNVPSRLGKSISFFGVNTHKNQL
jgi:hypothetical protein